MKKKIALLLAAVMLFAVAVPMNLFAGTRMDVSRQYFGIGNRQLVTNSGISGSGIAANGVGTDLTLNYTSNAGDAGRIFELNLTNAHWVYFREYTDTNFENFFGDITGSNPHVAGGAIADGATYDESIGYAFYDARVQHYTNIKSIDIGTATISDTRPGAASGATLTGGLIVGTDLTMWSDFLAAISKVDVTDPTKLVTYDGSVPYYTTVERGARSRMYVTVVNKPSANDNIVIPLIFKTTADADVKLSAKGGNVSDISTFNDFTIVTASSVARITIDGVTEARDTFVLDTIRLTETRPGNIVVNNSGSHQAGMIVLVAPDGYSFVNSTVTVQRTSQVGFTKAINQNNVKFDVVSAGYYQRLNAAGTSWSKLTKFDKGKFAVIKIEDDIQSTNYAGVLTVSGVTLRINKDNVAYNRDEVVGITSPNTIQFYNSSSLTDTNGNSTEMYKYGDTGATASKPYYVSMGINNGGVVTELKAMKRVDYGITFEALDDPTEVYAGVYVESGDDENTAPVTFAENSSLSIWASNVTRFELVDEDGNSLAGKVRFAEVYADDDDYGTFMNWDVEVFANYFTFVCDGVVDYEKGRIDFYPVISAAADFSGDVYLRATGRGIGGQTLEDVHIATVVAPVSITTKTSKVQVGYQAILVEDIRIKETDPGVLEPGDVVLKFQAFGADVGDISIANQSTLNLTINAGDGELDRIQYVSNTNYLTIPVLQSSSKTAMDFSLRNVYIYINRSVPEGKYDIVVGGDAFVSNYGTQNEIKNGDKYFTVWGVTYNDYIVVATPGSGKTLSRNVAIDLNNPSKVLVDNEPVDVSAAPSWIHAETSRTMLSIKYIAMALGVDENNVKWDNTTRTVAIFSDKTVVFYVDKNYYTLNGVTQYMQDTNGVYAYAVIRDSRSYVPIKYLGEAFGVEVLWNPVTRTAYFNPTDAQRVECALANE